MLVLIHYVTVLLTTASGPSQPVDMEQVVPPTGGALICSVHFGSALQVNTAVSRLPREAACHAVPSESIHSRATASSTAVEQLLWLRMPDHTMSGHDTQCLRRNTSVMRSSLVADSARAPQPPCSHLTAVRTLCGPPQPVLAQQPRAPPPLHTRARHTAHK